MPKITQIIYCRLLEGPNLLKLGLIGLYKLDKNMVEIFSSFLIALISTNCTQLFGKFIPTKCFFHPPPPPLCGNKFRLDHPVSTKGRKSVGRIFFHNHPPTPRM